MKNNDNDDLKPVKLEQPYSIIYPSGNGSTGDNLKDWYTLHRPKLTKQNLEDAWQAEDAFYKGPHTASAMNAPEGDSNDYFLKGKDRIIANRNASQMGDFLNQFHGMDYFRKAVPEVEKGLKGTGYDMGPSANIVKDNLKEAVDEGDTEKVENIIEKHPEEAQEALPEGTPIQEEAKQITEDDKPQNDEVNNEVVEDFVKEPSAESELFPVGYTTEQVTDPNTNSIPEDLPENNRPLDNFVLTNYDDDKDRGVLTPPIESNNDNKVEGITETGTDPVENTPELDNTPLENEAQQIESDTADNLDVDNIEDFEAYAQKAQDEFNKVLAEQKAKAKANKEFRGNKTGISRLPSTGMLGGKHWYEVDTEKLYEYANQLIDDGEGLLGEASAIGRAVDSDSWNSSIRGAMGSLATYGNGIRNRGRHLIAVRKYLQERGINPAELKPSTRKALLRTPIPGDKYNRKGKQEDYEYNLDVILKYSEGIGKDEDQSNSMANDKGIDKSNVGSSFINVPPSQEEGPIDTDDSSLPALNLQDYHKDVALNGERDLEPTETDDVDYRVVEDSDFVPPTYTIDDLDREIEEVSQWPVTNVDEAKAKQNKLKLLKSRRLAYGNASTSDTNWNYDRNTATGGRASPRAGIGSIGGAAGHGSMASTKPTKVGDSHNSIASKAPLPHALEDNQGRVVSVNGKATTAPSSNNNGAFRSGSFGLMSKAKSSLKSIPSKAPVSSGPDHMGSPMTATGVGIPGEINVDDGKQALIERLKQLLAQLTDEEKKNLGFSPALNQWNGKALDKLDGYTLQNLINQVEEYMGEMNNGMAQ